MWSRPIESLNVLSVRSSLWLHLPLLLGTLSWEPYACVHSHVFMGLFCCVWLFTHLLFVLDLGLR